MTDELVDLDLADVQPLWPKVVGIISSIYAGLFLTCSVVGLALMPVWQSLSQPTYEGASSPPPSLSPDAITWMLSGIGVVVLLGLLFAGINTILRKPLGRTLHLLVAAVSIVLTFVNAWNQMRIQTALEAWAAENPDTIMAQQATASGGAIGTIVSLGMVFIFGLVYPVFLLIWFGLVKTKPEDMTGGVEEVF